MLNPCQQLGGGVRGFIPRVLALLPPGFFFFLVHLYCPKERPLSSTSEGSDQENPSTDCGVPGVIVRVFVLIRAPLTKTDQDIKGAKALSSGRLTLRTGVPITGRRLK
ncbi:unnamed protein product [Boreogadus saida]